MRQSFDSKNFEKIFYRENRKGNYIEGAYNIFKPIKVITKRILKINSNFRGGKYSNNALKEKANIVKEKLLIRKHGELKDIFKKLEKKLEKKIEKDGIVFELKNDIEIAGKVIYTIQQNEKNPEIFFALKQVQQNIKKAFKINQSDRYEVANQVINMLDNNLPKFVVRTDIKSFFESISHDKLKEKIRKNHILNAESKKIIKQIFDEYIKLSRSDKGIPRGVGISPDLAELYMRDIDNKIKALPNLTYYARYVDDIIAIFTPNTKYDKVCYLKKLVKIIKSEDLKLNREKTKSFNLFNEQELELDFLGYRISKEKGKNSKFQVSITESRFNKYKGKIDKTIENYNENNKSDEKSARKLLKNRLKYLTGNTRLLNAKKHILIGIYFSNLLLTNIEKLDCLDEHLIYKLKELQPHQKSTICSKKLQEKLQEYSFKDGFNEKIFYKFNSKNMEDIPKIWRNL